MKNYQIQIFFEFRPGLTPDQRGFLFRMNDFSQNGHILVTSCTRKLVFGLNDAEYMVSYLSPMHLQYMAKNVYK